MSLGEPGRRQLRALSHPLRLRILSLVTGAPMSSAELARELDLTHAAVSFHVRQLAAAGYLELAETRSVRGGQERRYRARHGGAEQWRSEEPRLTVQAAATEMLRRLDAGTARWRAFSDSELWVDPQVWEDAVARIASAFTDLEAAARAPHTPGTVHVSATTMLFAVGDERAQPGPAPGEDVK
jgi:DNA-binding transcriptional ArsR family regulator